jgi:hypothetical protein
MQRDEHSTRFDLMEIFRLKPKVAAGTALEPTFRMRTITIRSSVLDECCSPSYQQTPPSAWMAFHLLIILHMKPHHHHHHTLYVLSLVPTLISLDRLAGYTELWAGLHRYSKSSCNVWEREPCLLTMASFSNKKATAYSSREDVLLSI